jgi:hypothetical protein
MDRESYAVIARLPSHTEFWYVGAVPQAGTRIVHHGEVFEVVSCEDAGRTRFVISLVKPLDDVVKVDPTIEPVALATDQT